MNASFFAPSLLLKNLTVFFLLTISFTVQAQDKSVQDTIAFLLRQHKNHLQQCDALYNLGTYYWNVGHPEHALMVMNQSKSLASKNDYPKGIYDANAIIGAIYLKQGDIPKVRSIVRESLQLANDEHNEYGANRANYLLANMYYQQRMTDSVIWIAKAVLDAPHFLYDSITLPKFNVLLGNTYLERGDLQRAMKCYLEALVIAEKIHNEPLMTVCLGNLANINGDLKNYKESLVYQRRAYSLALKNNQSQEVANLLLSMGSNYRDQLVLDSAVYYFGQSAQWFALFGDRLGVALARNNQGSAMIQLNQVDSGMYYLHLAKTEFIAINDSFQIANNALSLGTAWQSIPEHKRSRSLLVEAHHELLTCLDIATRKKEDDVRMKSYFALCHVQEALGNESEAFNYLKRYNNLHDSIRSQEYTQQMAELQTKYEFDRKETAIAKLNVEKSLAAEKISRQKILNYSLLCMAGLIMVSGSVVFRNVQKKREAEKQVAILEKQNAIETMRSKIASDVHDEMGANLTRLGLNAEQLLISAAMPEKEKQLAEKMSLQSKEIITGMREIIWASNPANDNLRSMLGFMRQYIDRFFDGTQIRSVVNFPHDAGEIILHPEVRRNLFLILKEALNNAVKYSGTDRIDIDFHAEDERFEFKVKDYGKGLEENKDDFRNGMHNMQMRAEQIQSLFRLINVPGQGVQIIVEGRLY